MILPLVLGFLSLYLIGLSIWNNRSMTLYVPPSPVDDVAEQSTSLEEEVDTKKEKININTATKEELMTLDGIGASIAERILQKREELGGFRVIEQVTEVDRIGEKTFDGIKDFIVAE